MSFPGSFLSSLRPGSGPRSPMCLFRVRDVSKMLADVSALVAEHLDDRTTPAPAAGGSDEPHVAVRRAREGANQPAHVRAEGLEQSEGGPDGRTIVPKALHPALVGHHPGPVELASRAAQRREHDRRRHDVRLDEVVDVFPDRPSRRSAAPCELAGREARDRSPDPRRRRHPRPQGRGLRRSCRPFHGSLPFARTRITRPSPPWQRRRPSGRPGSGRGDARDGRRSPP